jgi:hypothetical protein
MNDLFGWLIKLLVIVMLAPCFLSLGMALLSTALVMFLPLVIGLGALIGVVAGLAAWLVVRRRLPPPGDFLPPGEVPRIRRPRGVRTDR